MMLWLWSVLCNADEGLWPTDKVHTTPHASLWKALLPKLTNRSSTTIRSAVSLPNCSGALISEDGLVISNAHCIHPYLPDLSTTQHAENTGQETKIEGLFVFLTKDVLDVHKEIRRGIGDYTPLDRITYRSKRNKRVLLKACHEQSPRNRCSISLDPIQKRYQLTVLFQYSDIRLVHLPARKLSNIDIAFIRVYEQGTPLSTPQYLTANIKLPQKEEPIAVLGFPQQSHRYPHPKEWMHLLQNEYPYIAMGTENFLSILQPFLLQRSPQSKAHLLYAMMQETKENTKILSDLFSTEAPDTLIKQREQSFLEWTTKKSERKPYAQAYYAYEVLIAQQQSFAKDAIRLRWYSLASDLIFSARRRYGWRYNRPFPDANRIIGYKNKDKESIILHLEQLSSHLDEALDHKLLLYLFQQHPLPPVSSFLQGFTVVDSALIFLEDHKTELLHVQKSILQLDIRTPVPDNPWIDLGASLEQISFEISKRDARIKYSLRKKHRIFMEGMSIFLSDSFYPDADGSLRVSFGRIQQNWMSDIFSFEEQNHHISSFVPKYLNWFPYFISNVDATPGSSGSPTINIHGEWIGILFGGNNTRHTSAWFHAKHTENRHISTQSIFWYLSLNPTWNNLLDELQP